jgi:hypothetical protein
MGQRGRAPEPVALRVLKGETRPSQLSKAPQPTDPPVRPDDLSPEAAKVWDRILAATASSSHIGKAHGEALRQYSEVVATLNAMRPKGSKEWRELVLVSLRLARELCLTPATGGNLSAKPTTERKLDRFIRAG